MKDRMKTALALYEDDGPLDLPMIQPPMAAAYYPVETSAEEGVRLREYWHSLRKRIWVVIGITALVTSLVTVYMIRKPNVYEARARVRVDLENSNPMYSAFKSSSVVVNNSTTDPAYFNTQLQILSDEGLLRRAAKTLDLEHNATFLAGQNKASLWERLERLVGLSDKNAEKSTKDASGDAAAITNDWPTTARPEELEEATRLAPYVEALQTNLRVEPVKETRLPVKETRLIDIRFTHKDPRTAARVVNAMADSFAFSNLEKRTETSTTAGDFLQKRIAELQSQIRAAEEKLINYAKSNQILSLDASQNTVVERLAGLNKQLLEAENDRKMAEAAYQAAQNPNAAGALAQENAKQLSDMEQKLADLQQKRAQLLVDNTEEWPEVQEVTQQIATIEKQLQASRSRVTSLYTTNLETRYRQALARETSLRTAFNQQRGETLTQNEAAINYRIIQQEIETNKNLLDGLLQRAKENDVVLAGTPNNISVSNYSIVPQKPVGPQRLLTIAISMVLALAFGICFAIFLEYLDNTVRSSEDVERMLHLPALAVIPSVGGLTRKRFLPGFGALQTLRNGGQETTRPELLINAEGHSSISEAYKQLRTSVLLSTAGRAPKRLLITSAQPGEGKTTTAVNTAYSLAQTGSKVLVIDADMRRPTVHDIFNMDNFSGLSTILSREASEADMLSTINVHEVSGLSVMTSGSIPPNPAELIGSSQMKRLLDTLEPHFDHIVIDSPPVASVTDGVLLASMVDGVVFVVHGGRSSRALVRRARHLLLGVGARIFGVVLNNVNVQHHDYYYQGYYANPYTSAVPEAEGFVTGT